MERAVEASGGEWIFHLDSDGQVDAAEFGALWERRRTCDLVVGTRTDRDDPFVRLVLTFFVRTLVSVLAGARVRDANSPFKLMSRPLFDHLAPSIPPDAFAPSILVVLGAHRCGAVVAEVPITHHARPYGTSSLAMRRLASATWRSTWQTVRFRLRVPGAYRREDHHAG